MPLLLVDRYHPHLRREQQAVIDAGNIRKREELTLLEPEQLRLLALLSLLWLIIGATFFVAFDLVAYIWQMHTWPSGWTWEGVALWLCINVIGYFIVLPLHEGLHGLVFVFWGGKPHFGAKLPLALYCGARQQLFRRNQYLLVGLAPLMVISLVGIIVTLISPILASYTIFATVGNCSGAVGDLLVAQRLLRLSRHHLIEDTETGYRAWEVSPVTIQDGFQ